MLAAYIPDRLKYTVARKGSPGRSGTSIECCCFQRTGLHEAVGSGLSCAVFLAGLCSEEE